MDKQEHSKQQPDLFFVPLVCIGYLPHTVRRRLELRGAGLNDEQIKCVLKQDNYALN